MFSARPRPSKSSPCPAQNGVAAPAACHRIWPQCRDNLKQAAIGTRAQPGRRHLPRFGGRRGIPQPPCFSSERHSECRSHSDDRARNPDGSWRLKCLRYCMLMTIASPPKVSIRPSRLALRCMTTPRPVLQPQIATTKVAEHEAIAALRVGAGKQVYIRQIVDIPLGVDRGRPDPAHAQTGDRERIAASVIEERAAASSRAADIGRLNLVHVHRAVRPLAFEPGVGARRSLAASRNPKDGRYEECRFRGRGLSCCNIAGSLLFDQPTRPRAPADKDVRR